MKRIILLFCLLIKSFILSAQVHPGAFVEAGGQFMMLGGLNANYNALAILGVGFNQPLREGWSLDYAVQGATDVGAQWSNLFAISGLLRSNHRIGRRWVINVGTGLGYLFEDHILPIHESDPWSNEGVIIQADFGLQWLLSDQISFSLRAMQWHDSGTSTGISIKYQIK